MFVIVTVRFTLVSNNCFPKFKRRGSTASDLRDSGGSAPVPATGTSSESTTAPEPSIAVAVSDPLCGLPTKNSLGA